MNKFSSKTNSLILLKKKVKETYCKIPKFLFFSKNEFFTKKHHIYKVIEKKFKKNIIIRSSSIFEDKKNISNAGKFKSFQDIKINKEIIFDKIEKVISDFKSLEDQVIIQEFEKEILYSGVIFTRDQNTNAPYYIINYDKSGQTNLVTSGTYNPSSKTLIIYKKTEKIPKIFKNLIKIVKKIEKIFKSERLDIEFAIEKKTKKILIFQCRNLSSQKKFKNYDKEIHTVINNIKKKLIKIKKKNIYALGSTTIFSNMADWNPAEMIGTKPKNLSLSLYSELITNDVWSKQRCNYGYSDCHPNNLMLNLAGSPYIDLRIDFNSFMPKDLSSKIKIKVIDNAIKQLKNNPELHDKIEFEIIPTCYDFSEISKYKKILTRKEFSQYKNSLKNLTFNLLKNYKYIFNEEKNKLTHLSKQILKIRKSNLSHIQKIYYLVNDCKEYGTLPFAGLARLAFISTKILKELVKKNILTIQQYNAFFSNLDTITGQMDKDLNKYIKKRIRKQKFIEIYGHLRPTTYSFNSPNYKSNFNEYFAKSNIRKKSNKNKKFKLNNKQLSNLNKIFKKNKLNINAKDFLSFAKKSIELREWGKFTFTKSINEIFSNLELLGNEINIDKNDFDFISLNTILDYNSNLSQKRIEFLLKKEIFQNKNFHSVLNQIKLPDLIKETSDLNFFYLDRVNGNFITDKRIHGGIKYYGDIKKISEIKNKIVLIENADPGYDFIFTYGIKGFISKYGGANSHMAIRCLELGIPAIIGIGEKNFQNLKNQNTVFIDCAQNIFNILN